MFGSALIYNLLPASRLEISDAAGERDRNLQLVSRRAVNTNGGKEHRVGCVVGEVPVHRIGRQERQGSSCDGHIGREVAQIEGFAPIQGVGFDGEQTYLDRGEGVRACTSAPNRAKS